MPQTNVRFKGQYVDMNSGFYSRTFSMDFMYRFGGYKRKEDKKGGRNHKGGGPRKQGNYKGKRNGAGKSGANNRKNTPKE